jgi:hypothetical protein
MHVQAPRIVLLAAAALAAAGVSLAAANKPTSNALLDVAAAYVASFVQRFANVVSEEIYVQKWSTDGGVLLSQRQLRSDLLLTRPTTASPYYAFREVMEVDGKTISESESRLVRLFAKPSPNAVQEAEAITLESARYNLGNLQRTVNQPFFGLVLLQASYQKRFTYVVDKVERDLGEDVWIMQFKESQRPTFVRGSAGKDLPVRGRFWIAAGSGQVLRTELLMEDNQQKCEITTTFRMNDRFQVAVPVEMKEQYSLKGNRGRIQATATYQNFRQFEIETIEAPK